MQFPHLITHSGGQVFYVSVYILLTVIHYAPFRISTRGALKYVVAYLRKWHHIVKIFFSYPVCKCNTQLSPRMSQMFFFLILSWSVSKCLEWSIFVFPAQNMNIKTVWIDAKIMIILLNSAQQIFTYILHQKAYFLLCARKEFF